MYVLLLPSEGTPCGNFVNFLIISTWTASSLAAKEAAPVATFNMNSTVTLSKLLVYHFLEHVNVLLNYHPSVQVDTPSESLLYLDKRLTRRYNRLFVIAFCVVA